MGLRRLLLLSCTGLFFRPTVAFAMSTIAPKAGGAFVPNGRACHFYSQEASALHCSADNYLIQFGERYCQEFEDVEPSFTLQGQRVLNCIRPCLIGALRRPDLTCDNAQSIAFTSHVACYAQCGFCEMPLADKLAIGAVVWREFFDPEFRAVMDEVSQRCLANLRAVGGGRELGQNPEIFAHENLQKEN